MRLWIDATPLLLRSAGVKTYVYYWTKYLAQHAGPHCVDLFPLVGRVESFAHETSVAGGARTVAGLALLQSANYLGNFVLWPIGRRADIFHASHQLRRPPRNSGRLTATIYDMTCWLVPEVHAASNVKRSREFGEMVLKRADGLIAISAHSRNDAVRILGLKPERVEVIYPGVAEAFFTADVEAGRELARRYGLLKPYVLFVGTVEPRKNLDTLMDAYEALAPSVREEFELVVAGSGGWGEAGTLARLNSGRPGIRYLGYVPESDLPLLTAAATVFAYPSLYEGFGLPVAQAMAAGVPVVTSTVSSLPEVAGGGGLLADPRSVEEVRAALERVLLSPSLRAQLGRCGVERAARYRWDVCAQASWAWFANLANAMRR